MISELEKTILYMMAESIAYKQETVIDERISWGNELLKKINSCNNKEQLFK